MIRPASLFAIGTIVLFVLGIVSPWIHLNGFIGVGDHIIGPQPVLFAFAALFGVFASAYSLWMLKISSRAGVWHFWLSAVAVMLFCCGFILVSSPSSRTAPSIAPVFALELAAVLLFLGAQVVFAASLVSAVLRRFQVR